MDWIKKHSKEIGIGIGVAAIAGIGLYFAFGDAFKAERSSAETVKPKPVEPKAKIDEPEKAKLDKTQKGNIASGIKVERNEGILTMDTLKAVVDAASKFAAADFIALVKKNRDERRKVADDFEKYGALWNKFHEELEGILTKAYNEILKEVKITDSDFEDAKNHYMGQGNLDVIDIQSSIHTKLKESITTSKDINLESLRKILAFEVEKYKEEKKNIKEVRKTVKSDEEVTPILQQRVADALFKEFESEEEDIQAAYNKPETAEDKEVQNLLLKVSEIQMEILNGDGAEGL